MEKFLLIHLCLMKKQKLETHTKIYGGRIMIKERKKIISFLVMVVILLAGGVGLGYYIWGMEKQTKPDYKKYLDKTIDYIASIENNNQAFIKESKNFKTDISLLKKKVKEGQDRLEIQTKTLQTKIASIQDKSEKDKASLQSALNENEKLVLERDQLKARIAELVNELNTLRQETGDIKPEATGDIKPEATEAQADPIESPVKEQEHPGIKSHQTESTPLIEQEQ